MTTIKRRARPNPRRARPRRGRVVDLEYLAWLATQPPIVPGPGRITIHHVRRFGEPKNDRRGLPLPESRHMIEFGMGSITVEHGKKIFEAAYGVDLEAEIVEHNRRYESEKGETQYD